MSKNTTPEQFELFMANKNEALGFTPPEPLPELMQQVETMIENDNVDEYYQGAYQMMVELLSCPTACLIEKCIEALLNIIKESSDMEPQDDNEEGVCDVPCITVGTKPEKPKDEVETLIDNDISDEDMIEELRRVQEPRYSMMDY